MPTSFQPEKPHSPAPGGRGTAAVFVTALLISLVVVMAVAVVAPRLSQTGETSWLVTIGAGMVAFVIVIALGLRRGS